MLRSQAHPDPFEYPFQRCPKLVIGCHLVAGDFDYILKIRVRDIADYNRLQVKHLFALPGVRQTRNFFVMKGVRDNCPSSKQMGLLSVFHKGGSGSSLFDVKPLGVDGSSGGFGWSVF